MNRKWFKDVLNNSHIYVWSQNYMHEIKRQPSKLLVTCCCCGCYAMCMRYAIYLFVSYKIHIVEPDVMAFYLMFNEVPRSDLQFIEWIAYCWHDSLVKTTVCTAKLCQLFRFGSFASFHFRQTRALSIPISHFARVSFKLYCLFFWLF